MTKQIHAGIAVGQVSEGYKLEHGYVIPKEWKVVHFDECFHRLTQKNTENNQNCFDYFCTARANQPARLL